MNVIIKIVCTLSIFLVVINPISIVNATTKKKATAASPRTLKLKTIGSTFRNNGEYCYARDANPYRNFGTSTSYKFVRAPTMEIPKVCKPVYVWALVRVGTRYYGQYDAGRLNELKSQILSNHERDQRGSLCAEDLKNLRAWTSKGSGKTSDDLAPQGKIEMSDLGKRLGQKLKDVTANKSDSLRFQTTDNKAAKESAKAFVEGMLGRGTHPFVSSNEDVFRFIENSKEFEDKVTNKAFATRDTCLNSKQMQTLIKTVSNRLGFENALPEKSIRDMYHACAFEKAWAPASKPAFCAAFTKKDHQLLEYCHFDILGYYEWGYGSSYNLKMHSPIVNDLISKMNAASQSENGQPKGNFNFASAAALTHTITKLGLYRDEEHLSENEYGLKKWSMTKICPFSGNLIAVLHKCERGERNRISFYHNEHLIRIPGCSSTLCSLSQFQNIISSSNK